MKANESEICLLLEDALLEYHHANGISFDINYTAFARRYALSSGKEVVKKINEITKNKEDESTNLEDMA